MKPYHFAHFINNKDHFSALNCLSRAIEQKFAQGVRAQHGPLNELVNDLDSLVKILLVPGWRKKGLALPFSEHVLMYST